MATLTIGRVSLSCDPESLQISPRSGARAMTITGGFTAATIGALKAARDELAETLRSSEPVPVTWDEDDTVDGFYQPEGGSVVLRSLTGTGFATFQAQLRWLGDDNSVRFVSLVSGVYLANNHSYTTDLGYVGTPYGMFGYTPVSTGTPRSVARTSADGAVRCHLGVADSSNPEWHVSPANFYKGACKVYVAGHIRAGLTCPNSPTSWYMENGLVKVAPGTDGALVVSHYDTDDWRATTWDVKYDGSVVGAWRTAQILTNRPERTAIRLVQHRGTQGRMIVDLGLRRGSRILEGVYYSDSASYAMALNCGEVGTTSGTPTGSMKADSADAYGHRWMIGSELTTTLTTASGGMAKTAARLPFMIGKEVDEGDGLQTADEDDALWAQYMGWRSERVRVILP